jgi:hypothetical protein
VEGEGASRIDLYLCTSYKNMFIAIAGPLCGAEPPPVDVGNLLFHRKNPHEQSLEYINITRL